MIISGTVDILSGLSKLSVNSYSEASYVATQTIAYTHALTNNEITKSQFDDLIADLKVDQMVATTADELQVKSMLTSLMGDLMAVLAVAFPLA